MRAMSELTFTALCTQPALRACGQCNAGVIGGARAHATAMERPNGSGTSPCLPSAVKEARKRFSRLYL